MQRFLVTVAMAALLLVGSAAVGQSFNDPEGTPLGCTDKSGQGQKLDGVTSVVFTDVNLATGIASSAEVTTRLTNGKQTAAFFTVVVGPLDTNNFEVVRDALVAALEAQVKESFFPEACANDGCPAVVASLRCFENLAQTDDGGDDLILVADIVIQMSERL